VQLNGIRKKVKPSVFHPYDNEWMLFAVKGQFMDSTTRELIDIFTRTSDPREMEDLFQEIFTPSEISTLTLRWQLLKDLYEGKTQRKIAAEHKISLCKITRGSKILKTRGSYLKKVLDGIYRKNKYS
jgi:TrpR family trp operon transcriptional repressor